MLMVERSVFGVQYLNFAEISSHYRTRTMLTPFARKQADVPLGSGVPAKNLALLSAHESAILLF